MSRVMELEVTVTVYLGLNLKSYSRSEHFDHITPFKISTIFVSRCVLRITACANRAN